MALAHLWGTLSNRRARGDAQPGHRRPAVRWHRLPLRMESLEDRIAPDATPLQVLLAAHDPAAETRRLNDGDDLNAVCPDAGAEDCVVQVIGDPASPDAVTIDFDLGGFVWAPQTPGDRQVFFLEAGGAADVDYRGPITVEDIDVPAFAAPGALAGQEAAVLESLVAALNAGFPSSAVEFTTVRPAGGEYSTIYVGGDSSPFAEWGRYWGLAEEVDAGNRDHSDSAFVFAAEIDAGGLDAAGYGRALAAVIGHEAGHLLGAAHDHNHGDGSPLADVAFDPKVHVAIGNDVVADVLDDGKVTINGQEYTVHPKIVEALTNYPSYYNAGAVGPDGFPDSIMGQFVIHAESNATWATRVLDMAWQAQSDPTFTPAERSQILAFAYGFLTHSTGDHWAHTLVNDFAEGVAPGFVAAAASVPGDQRDLGNQLRHLMTEAYIADAMEGVDTNPNRTVLPDGDVSDDSTPGINYDAPIRFIYEALIRPFPEDPTPIVDLDWDGGGLAAVYDPISGTSSFVRAAATLGGGLSGLIGDDIKVGHVITVTGFSDPANNGKFRVTEVFPDSTLGNVLATKITVDRTLVPELADGDEKIVVYVPKTPVTTLNVDAAAGKFTRTTGSFVDEGFIPGMRFSAFGFNANFDNLIVKTVTATELTVVGKLNPGDTTGDGNEQLVVQGDRGPIINTFFRLRDKIYTKAVERGDRPADFGSLLGTLLDKIVTGEAFPTGFLDDLATAYLYQWADSIDDGIRHWGEFGLAFTRAMFDPQSRRDVQNKIGAEFGADTLANTARGDAENAIGFLKVLLNELDDPNNDGSLTDSFLNNHLLAMAGLPPQLGVLRTAIDSFNDLLDEFIGDDTEQPFNPTEATPAAVQEHKEGFIKKLFRKRFGIDFDTFEVFSKMHTRMDVKEVTIAGETLPFFKPGDRERLDQLMGLSAADHQPGPPDPIPNVVFHPGAVGPLEDDAHFDKTTFAPYKNSVTLTKLALLMETPPDGETVGAGQLSALYADLSGVPTYDATKLNLHGAHGGNVLTSTLPGVAGNTPWLATIDADKVWRTDSRSTTSLLFRVSTQKTTDSPAEWKATVTPGQYKVYATWLGNVTQDFDNLTNTAFPDQKLSPASNARYTVLDDTSPFLPPVPKDQREFASGIDFQGFGFSELGTYDITSTTLRVRLSNVADGHVVAGPILVERVSDGTKFLIQNLRDPDTLAPLPPADDYTDSPSTWTDLVYPTGTGNNPLWESELLRDGFRALFDDWQNGALDFPALGDATSPDPNSPGPPIPKNERPSHATPFGPVFPDSTIRIPIPDSLKNAILSGLNGLVDVVKAVENAPPLSLGIPGLDKSLAQILGISDKVDENVRKPIADYFANDSTPTVGELFDVIKSKIGGRMDTLSPILEFDVDLRKMFSADDIKLALGAEAEKVGLELGGNLHVDAAVKFVDAVNANLPKLTVGVNLTPNPTPAIPLADRLYIKADRAVLSADIHGTNLNFGARFGFLGVGVVNGTVDLDADVTLTFHDPNGDGKITLGEIAATPLSTLVTLEPAPTGSVSGKLPIQVQAGLPGMGSVTVGTVEFGATDLFDPATYGVKFNGTFGDVFNFNNIDAASLVGLLGQVTFWLDEFRRSDEFAGFDVPLVGPALDKVLGVADAFRDKLLIDDADNGVDDAKTLLFDVNAALAAAGLGDRLRAEKTSDGKLKLISNDATITKLEVGAAAGLGFTAAQTATDPAVIFEAVTAQNAAPANGQLAADATLSIKINDGTAVTATVKKSDTDDNVGIGDDKWKLVNGQNAPTFSTVQEMALKLVEVLGLNDLEYHPAEQTLTWSLDLAEPFGQLDLPLGFSLDDLPDFLQLQTGGKVHIAASGELNLTLGVFLGPAEASTKLTGSEDLDKLNGGINISTDQRITGATDVRTAYGQLSDDAKFTLAVNGVSPVSVTVTKSSAADNTTATDLAADIKAALTTAGLDAKVQAEVVTGTPGQQRVKLVGKAGVTSLVLTAATNDPTVKDMGFAAQQPASGAPAATELVAAKDLPALRGRLTGDASFGVSLDNVATSPVTIIVPASATTTNRFAFDIVGDVQTAIDAHPELKGAIEVSFSDDRLILTAKNKATTFTVSDVNTVAAGELGLANGEGNSADFVITVRDGTSHPITLDGLKTLQDVIDEIHKQSDDKVTAALNDRKTGLTLTDNTFDDVPPGTGKFQVVLANNSTAALGLGIVQADAPDDPPEGGGPDGVIEGTDIAGLTPLDRFFIQATPEGEDPLAGVGVVISTPAPVTATAKFGFVGLSLQGGGTLPGNKALDASLTVRLNEPEGSTDGRVSLAELINGLDDIGSLLDLSLTGTGRAEFSLAADPALADLGITIDPSARVAVDVDLGDVFADTPVPPDVNFTFPDFGNLLRFGNLEFNFQNIIAGLRRLADFLGQFEEFDFLNKPLPVAGVSISELINVADKFASAVDDARANPAGTVQVLEDKLKQAFGLPPSSNAINLVLVHDNNGTPGPDDDFDILKFEINLAAAFSDTVGLDFDLLPDDLPLELGGGADLTAAGSAGLKLAIGFDIEDPTRVFLFDDTGLEGTLNLGGAGLAFRAAVGPLGVFVNGGSVDIHGTATGSGDKLFHAGFDDLAYVNDRFLMDFDDLGALFDGFSAEVGGAVHVALPVFFPTDSHRAGTVLFDAGLSYDTGTGEFDTDFNPRAIDENGDPIPLAQLFAFDPSELSLLDQLLLGVDGVDLFLEGLQDVLDGQIGGFSLPLIGDKLAGAADVIGDFRSGFVEGFREAIEQLANPGAAFRAAGSGADPVSRILFNLLGPGGLDLLLDSDDPGTDVTVADITYVTNLNDPNVQAQDVFFDWDFELGDTLVDAGAGIGFDIGIPGLGLETTGEVNLDIGWELALGFGLNYADGFYFDIADPSEFQLDVDVTVPGVGIKGTLGFLQVTAEEDVDPTAPDPVTHLGATFAVDIQNRSDPTDTKLGFTELGRIGIDAKIGADAVADLAMRLALSSDLVPNAPTNFPSVVADFLLDWRLGDRAAQQYVSISDLDGGFLSNGLRFVGFDHVGVDLGSYFTDLIGPIVEKVQEVTEPIKPFLDFLTEPIPVISDLAGPTSLLDIAAMSGAVNPGIIKAIEVVDQVVDIANSISVPSGGNVILYFDRWLDALVIFDAANPPAGGLPDLTNPNLDLEGLADDLLGGLGEFLPEDLAAALGEVAGNLSAGVNKMLPGGSASAGFQLPIIKDPSQVFGMLMGQQADLVTFTMDALTVEADFSAFFSIFGPLGVSINAEFDGQFGPFKFGYDTLGITEFAKSGFKNPLLLFDGLYVSDLGVFTDTKIDVPELQFDAGLWAAAELNLGIARGGVGGGLFAEIDFDLHDPDADGRVRLKEIVTSVLNEFRYGNPALSPLAMFDITGKLTAELFAFLKINFPWPIPDIDKKFQITDPIVLLDFESNFERFPTLATELPGGVLQLNMGKFADQRVEGDKTDGAEHFKAKQGSDASHILLWAPSLGVDESEAQEYQVTSRILALGGEGNDIIDLSLVTGNYQYELEGNAGNDVILAGSGTGSARILGGAGDDNLSGGGGDDVVFGETGNDVVAGGGGRDWLFGDGSVKDAIQTDSVTNRTTITGAVKANDGSDSVYGGAGEDIVFGSGGVDYIEGGPDADVLIGDGGKVTVGTDRLVVTLRSLLTPPEPDPGRLELAVEDTSKGQGAGDTIRGDGGNDHVYGGMGADDLFGGDDADVIYGEAGKDTIHGDAGNDIAFGDFGTFEVIDGVLTPVTTVGGEADLIFGGTENDQLLGGAGDDLIVGDAGDDWAWGGTGLDEIHGGEGADHLYGNADPDRLFGEAGPDFIEGGHGNDLALGGTENDLLIAGYGSDVIDGEQGSDAYQITARGGPVTELSIAYDSGTLATETDTLTLVGTADPDTVLLRAMADYYFPSEVKLIGDASSKGLTDKVFASGEPDKLAALLQAIEDAYGPHDIPAGLMSELIDLFVDEIRPGVLDAISSSYVADPDPESTVPTLESLIALVDDPDDPDDPADPVGILNTDSRGKLAEIQKAIKAAYGDNPVPGAMFDRITNAFNTFTPADGLKDALEAAIEDRYQSEALVGLLGIVRGEFGEDGINLEGFGRVIDRIVAAYAPGGPPTQMVDDLVAAFEADPADLDGFVEAITDNYDPDVPVPGLETDTGFVALINNGGENVERFNYRNMEGLVVNTLQGDDYVVSDDVIAATTINLGIGDDRVQIGQVFRSERTRDPGDELITGITAEDVYTTTEITRGWLSNGVSRPTTINGGDGNDQFTVFRNVAVLNLNGGDGDDLFTVRAFALKGSSDSERARTDMKGDGGADTILYVVNAPVGIDGGDGLDTVRVIGTEFADDFVVTDSGVFGAGLNVTFVNIEKLVADGAEGDDRYFVLSTGLDVVTEIDGGLGSDTFFVGGNPSGAPIPVISDDFRGHSGIVLHSVESTDTAWDDLKVEGLSANVGDDEQDYILVTESGGSTRVVEGATTGGAGWEYDGYSIRLTHQPGPGQVVTINVVPAGMSPEDRARQFRDLEFFAPSSLDDLDGAPHGDPLGFDPLTDLPNLPSVQFDETNWFKPQFIKFRAANQGQYQTDDPPGPPLEPPFGSVTDTASEGRRFTFINHTAQNSTDPDYRDAQLLSVKVQMEDNDRDGVIVTPTDRGNTILEDGFTDFYDVVLAHAPTADVTVSLSVLNGQVALSGTTLTFPAGVPTLTFTPDNWDEPQTITLTAVDDAVLEGFHTDYISYKVQSADVTETIPLPGFIQVDGNFDQLGVQSIPADKPTTYVLLPHKPVPGTVSVKVGGVSLDPARFSVTGNTLSFLTADGTAELRIGKVEAQYSYVEAGYDGSAVRDTVVDVYDNDAPTVLIEQTNGSTDVIEADPASPIKGTTDTYRVRLSRAPSANVEVKADAVKTRTTYGRTAHFVEQVTVNGTSDTVLTFTPDNWDEWQTVTVAAINDDFLDGNDTQVFAPDLQTVNKIRGPLIVEGAAGLGSLSLPAPLMLPHERNALNPDGTVVAFTAGTGPGATETMTVQKADLLAVVAELQTEDSTITAVEDLVGKTLEMAKGPGTGVILDPARPDDLYDRFWLINAVEDLGDAVTLTLQNPSAVDPARLQPGDTPDETSQYAITALSLNFFADEREQVDYLFVFDEDSVANDSGALTSSDGAVLGFDSATQTMTVDTAALQAVAKLDHLTNVEDLEERQIEITVGPGVGRAWTIDEIENVVVDGNVVPGIKRLVLIPVTPGADPTDRSEFRIAGGDTHGRVVGFGMGPNVLFSGRPQPGGITYGDMEVVQVSLGSGNDTVRVDYATNSDDHTTERAGKFYTLTLLDTGKGNDTVNVALTDGDDAAISISTQAGDDVVNGAASTLPLVVFGGDGNDQITGGSAADILFGDIGRVDYVKTVVLEDGTTVDQIVTRLGHSVPPNPVNPHVTGATALTVSDSALTFPTDQGGLVGLSVQAISPQGHVQFRTIVANDEHTITVDRPWDETPVFGSADPDDDYYYRISALPEDQTDGVVRAPKVIWSIDRGVGGADVIAAGAGADFAIGGAGGDTIDGDAGADVIFGDSGRIDLTGQAYAGGEVTADPVVKHLFTTDTEEATGGADLVHGGTEDDIVLGGVNSDALNGDAGNDKLVGDNGEFVYDADDAGDLSTLDAVRTLDTHLGGGDVIGGDAGADLVLAGTGDDTGSGGTGDDIVLGDFAEALLVANVLTTLRTTDPTLGGSDVLSGDGEDDVLVGGARGDSIDGGRNEDLIFGDAVEIHRRPGHVIANPRFRTLTGTRIYARADLDGTSVESGKALVDDAARDYRDPAGSPAPDWAEFEVIDLRHTAAIEAANDGSFGNDYIAGGTEHDQIFGQLGDDTIQGDGSITTAAAVSRTPGGVVITPSLEDEHDGDDYIEGNGGSDVVFGGLGQDDIIGGSSNLFTLDLYSERPDGADVIFGGAGRRAGRLADVADGVDAFFAERHARDADTVVGDNGNIYRLVGISGTDGGAFLTFNYDVNGLATDGYSPARRIIPRAVSLIDYTPGGPDFTPAAEPGAVARNPLTNEFDIGAADEVHGESGDDFLYGMVGKDVLYGDGQDDNMVGGYDADWMSGGNGDDGMLGDDGRLFASRNGTYGEPLYGVAGFAQADLTKLITLPGQVSKALINVDGLLKYTADLTPDNLKPGAPTPPDPLFRPVYANDIVYGGLGHDAIHAGAGDDAVSGAEAPTVGFTNNYDQAGTKLNGAPVQSDFYHPVNPGNVLGYSPATTTLAQYDANDSLRRVMLDPVNGSLWKGPAADGLPWLLDFNPDEGPPDTKWVAGTDHPSEETDGDDHLFADLGNDWATGGTGRDVLYGGWGDDVLNMDDVPTTNGGLNNGTDTNPSWEDLGYGGAGRDVLVMNTNGDRGFDWVGEFNTFRTPFAQFGSAAVNRLLLPGLPMFLYDLSKSEGADPTLAAQYGTDPARNGEPFGELGLVLQSDAAWGAQSGSPRDPQGGNLPGGPVDVKNNPGTAGLGTIYSTAAGGKRKANRPYLTDAELAPVVAQAKQFWAAAVGAARAAELERMPVVIGDLPGNRLGAVVDGVIVIDGTAAGRGWFVDPTPGDSSEFAARAKRLLASHASPAFGRMDLLSVVLHELGHALGLDHGPGGVMGEKLRPGERTLPEPAPVPPVNVTKGGWFLSRFYRR